MTFETLVKRLAKNLRRERLAKGFSQEGLALTAEVDRTFVSQIEREIANPSMKTLCQIADALKVDPVELLLELDKALGTQPLSR